MQKKNSIHPTLNRKIMAKYIKQEMPNLNGTEEPQVYYRLKTNRNISSKEFVERISRNGSAIDRGEMEGFLIRIADGLAEFLGNGFRSLSMGLYAGASQGLPVSAPSHTYEA